jgi:hypothetical protein
MDQHFRRPKISTNRLQSGVKLRFIGDIAGIGARVCNLSLQQSKKLLKNPNWGNLA